MMLGSKSIPLGKAVYFASDFHLGTPDYFKSREREDKIIEWLNEVKVDAAAIYLLGDIFDFWFEYKYVVPKHHVRLLGKLADISDSGIELFIFTGNHDMWLFNYLEQEIGATIIREPVHITIGKHLFHIGHGDGLGKGDYMYKILKKVFKNRWCQILFKWLHPDIGHWIANKWSRSSRIANNKDEKFLGEGEWLWGYCKEMHRHQPHDFYIFGHRHLPLDLKVGDNGRYINLGEWLHHCMYVRYDGNKLEFLAYKKKATE
jgi:UDP-2,3-diacylglucosamine hydrolase